MCLRYFPCSNMNVFGAGNDGVVWILSGLYFLSAILTKFISLPDNAKTSHSVKGNPEVLTV